MPSVNFTRTLHETTCNAWTNGDDAVGEDDGRPDRTIDFYHNGNGVYNGLTGSGNNRLIIHELGHLFALEMGIGMEDQLANSGCDINNCLGGQGLSTDFGVNNAGGRLGNPNEGNGEHFADSFLGWVEGANSGVYRRNETTGELTDQANRRRNAMNALMTNQMSRFGRH